MNDVGVVKNTIFCFSIIIAVMGFLFGAVAIVELGHYQDENKKLTERIEEQANLIEYLTGEE